MCAEVVGGTRVKSEGLQLVVQAPTPPADSGMDWLSFVSSMTGTLIWPALVAALVWSFRKQITRLLESLEEWEGFGGKAKFRERSEDVLEETQIVAVAENVSPPAPADPESETQSPPASTYDFLKETDEKLSDQIRRYRLANFANLRPELQIISEFILVERAVDKLAAANGIDPSMNFTDKVVRLTDHRVITPSTSSIIFNLRSLRNRANHARVDKESADNYHQSVATVVRVLEKALVEKPAG